MAVVSKALLLVALAGCQKEPSEPAESPSEGAFGAILLNSRDVVEPTSCTPAFGPSGAFIVVDTPRGQLRFEDKRLFWNPDVASPEAGSGLTCKLDCSWSGGHRDNGTAYWSGMLSFDCI